MEVRVVPRSSSHAPPPRRPPRHAAASRRPRNARHRTSPCHLSESLAARAAANGRARAGHGLSHPRTDAGRRPRRAGRHPRRRPLRVGGPPPRPHHLPALRDDRRHRRLPPGHARREAAAGHGVSGAGASPLPVGVVPSVPAGRMTHLISRRTLLTGAAGLGAIVLAGRAGGARWAARAAAAPAKIPVVAAENFYGDVVGQIASDRVLLTSIISDPNVDPHEYE